MKFSAKILSVVTLFILIGIFLYASNNPSKIQISGKIKEVKVFYYSGKVKTQAKTEKNGMFSVGGNVIDSIEVSKDSSVCLIKPPYNIVNGIITITAKKIDKTEPSENYKAFITDENNVNIIAGIYSFVGSDEKITVNDKGQIEKSDELERILENNNTQIENSDNNKENQAGRTTLVVKSPVQNALLAENKIKVTGIVNNAEAEVYVNGKKAKKFAGFYFTGEAEVVEGTNDISVVALTSPNDSVKQIITIIADLTSPKLELYNPIDNWIVEEPEIFVSGKVNDNRDVTIKLNGQSIAIDQSGNFETNFTLSAGTNTLTIIAEDEAGRKTVKSRSVNYHIPVLPPNPADVAPPIDTTVVTNMMEMSKFIYEGENPIQVEVYPGTIDSSRVCIIRGRVLNADNEPLSGVYISTSEYNLGHTYTRDDGWFDFAVNGGGVIDLNYSKNGYLNAIRKISTDWRSFSIVEDVMLIKFDTKVTKISSSSDSIQVHQSNNYFDAQGERRATLMFKPGTIAEKISENGEVSVLDSFSVRATEYTVGKYGNLKMPADLPPTTTYTYCVELSVDETILDYSDIKFSNPVAFYLDNYYEFPVGGLVPCGYYNWIEKKWIPSETGMILQIADIQNGKARLDYTGDAIADPEDSLSILGIDSLELKKLAELYSVGDSFWRVEVQHFSTYDLNYLRHDISKDKLELYNEETEPEKEDKGCGSIIGIQNRTLGEYYGIDNTPVAFYYNSKNEANNSYILNLMHPPVRSTDIDSTEIEIEIAGQVIKKICHKDEWNSVISILWDGKDAFDREVIGVQKAKCS
ncbi:MAG: hypothetical protein GXX85_11050, partial [Ignavibacteria bacterium]|nr:hypothetical protein [Ignavibacteria bacterium]